MIPIQRAFDAYGIDFANAKIDCDISCETQADANTRIPLDSVTKLLHYGNSALAEKDFVVKMTDFFHPSVFHSLGYAILSSSTLYDALKRVVQYNEAVSNSNSLSLKELDNSIVLMMSVFKYEDTGRPVFDPIGIEAYFATIVHISRQILGPNWTPKQVYFEYNTPITSKSALEAYFGCEVIYSALDNGICFDATDAYISSTSGDAEMALVHEKMFKNFLKRVSKESICQSIDNYIRDQLPLGAPNQEQVASSVGMSLRSLQRKLQLHGTTYKDLLDNLRRKLALEYLQQSHLSITEISYLVGFSNVGNFNRAFKRWTGTTPSKYRSPTEPILFEIDRAIR